MSDIQFETCLQAWRYDEQITVGGGSVTLQLLDGTLLGEYPLSFLRRGGRQTARKSYLELVARILTSVPNGWPSRLHHERFLEDDDDAEIREGAYIFHPLMTPIFPEFAQNGCLAPDCRDFEVLAYEVQSGRASDEELSFQTKVLFRDGHCLASDNRDPYKVVATRIVPTEFLRVATKIPNSVWQYSVWNGLTLRKDLHDDFCMYRWGIFVSAGEHIIHVFGTSDREMHGRVIDYGDSMISQRPDTELLMWHYKQCLLARIRGADTGVGKHEGFE